jgi:hypothetical protein
MMILLPSRFSQRQSVGWQPDDFSPTSSCGDFFLCYLSTWISRKERTNLHIYFIRPRQLDTGIKVFQFTFIKFFHQVCSGSKESVPETPRQATGNTVGLAKAHCLDKLVLFQSRSLTHTGAWYLLTATR